MAADSTVPSSIPCTGKRVSRLLSFSHWTCKILTNNVSEILCSYFGAHPMHITIVLLLTESALQFWRPLCVCHLLFAGDHSFQSVSLDVYFL